MTMFIKTVTFDQGPQKRMRSPHISTTPTCAYVCQKTLQHGLGSVRERGIKRHDSEIFIQSKLGPLLQANLNSRCIRDSKPPPHPSPCFLTLLITHSNPPPGDPRLGAGQTSRCDSGGMEEGPGTGLPLRVGWAVWWREIRRELRPCRTPEYHSPSALWAWPGFVKFSAILQNIWVERRRNSVKKPDVEANPYQTSGGLADSLMQMAFRFLEEVAGPSPAHKVGDWGTPAKSKGLPCAFGDTG